MADTAAGLGPRRAALRILEATGRGRPFDAARDDAVASLGERDRRLAHELAAGVLRRRTELDAALAPLLPRGLAGVAPRIADVLRLGAYQLTALDRVPPHAAVSTSVALAREAAGARAAGFVNAVLRRVAERSGAAAGERIPPTDHPDAVPGDAAEELARRYSHPVWLVRRWLERYGPAGTRALLEWNNTVPPLVIQPARSDLKHLRRRLAEAGIECEPAPFDAGLVTGRRSPRRLPDYDEGAFFVQDPAHALVVRYADVPPGATVLDACAAPGGKALALGRRAGVVVAADASPVRVRRLAENLGRAGRGHEHPVVADAALPPIRQVDAVLVDAPCLGTGTFARHPDARWKASPDALGRLAHTQATLLDRTADVVRPGGLLVYATCSLEPEENERQVDRFLARHPEFRLAPSATVPAELLTERGELQILPHRHRMDGAFAARLRKVA
ncbi:MAG TPA: 16S rRNA (cytosine(967)-C(5))-methyltransferase RsmB [Gemmatimonadales bacterium]|nr:16S rRNA (cytosine(967)-C(5))-methyltransferase RsmB [Gemmatimonadales bacterium]